ncbi:unnamed protein product [Dracunculus medinensis]|uniref:DUF4806 domain-containing protein n=1 Tax=Dracunculus medinensis TaxID=318479 RepID=A0A158Q5W6_DRAME|nr:unnamed protein product [Dracunculus medinensis]
MKCGMHFAEYHTLTMSNPFNSHEMPSIVLKPSDGNTFYNYKVGQDLHIGLYVHGMIYSYWSKGIMIETCASWMDRIHIYKFNRCFNIANLLRKFFNEHSDRFSLADYDEEHWNCFNFVIEFLKFFNPFQFSSIGKESFVHNYIQPTLKYALRYSFLVRQLQESAISILPLKYNCINMAECLEVQEDEAVDSDRLIDRQNFKIQQHEIAMHDFREYGVQLAFVSNHRNFTDKPLKIRILNWKRRLKRVKIIFERLCTSRPVHTNISSNITNLMERIDLVMQRLEDTDLYFQNLASGFGRDIEIPEWSQLDVDLFTGGIIVSKDRCDQEVADFFDAVGVLFLECKEIIKTFRIETSL